MTETADAALNRARAQLGLPRDRAELVRRGENTIYRLPHGVIARVGQPGSLATARREIAISRWLTTQQIPVVQALDLAQPILAAGRPVTFWHDLGDVVDGTPGAVAVILRALHQLRPPCDLLPTLEPFAGLDARLDSSAWLPSADQVWLREHLGELRRQHRTPSFGMRAAVVHGDARGGNIVATANGIVLLDLERCATGPPEWDLVSTAHKLNVGWISSSDYAEFRDGYGQDVTTWPGYPTLRDIRELRETLYAARLAAAAHSLRSEACQRLACIRGNHGPRPWRWTPI